MRSETGLAAIAVACAAVAPCTFGMSAGVGVLLAVAGIVVAWRNERSVVAPVLALVGNVLAATLVVVLAIIAALVLAASAMTAAATGVTASIEAIEQAPHVARTVGGALSPAGFWGTYRHEELVEHESSQGPWGGNRYLHWHATGEDVFDEDDVLQFAVEHGWRLHSRGHLGVKEIYAWSPECLLPASECTDKANHEPYSLSPAYLGLPKTVRRKSTAKFTVMSFDTGWVQFPDLEEMARTVVGFASISADGRDLYVAHHWGD
ncbi:MAG: hypothetical protein NTV21_05025 [Planctomycetota bacterium]|nr:hypothetical protein [Planctomycetota bacterium]